MITYDYLLKKLSMKRQKNKFKHKVKYGRSLETKYGYDLKSHQEHYNKLKNRPYDIRTWEL
jgi:hypothetical protein